MIANGQDKSAQDTTHLKLYDQHTLTVSFMGNRVAPVWAQLQTKTIETCHIIFLVDTSSSCVGNLNPLTITLRGLWWAILLGLHVSNRYKITPFTLTTKLLRFQKGKNFLVNSLWELKLLGELSNVEVGKENSLKNVMYLLLSGFEGWLWWCC